VSVATTTVRVWRSRRNRGNCHSAVSKSLRRTRATSAVFSCCFISRTVLELFLVIQRGCSECPSVRRLTIQLSEEII